VPTPEAAEWSEFTAILNQSSLSPSSSSAAAMPHSSSFHNKATADEAPSPFSWGTKNLPTHETTSSAADHDQWGQAGMPSALGSFMNAFTGQQQKPQPPPPENNSNKKKAAALATDTSLSSSFFNAAAKTFKGGWGNATKHNHDNTSAATSPDSATPTAADSKHILATQMTNNNNNNNPFKNGWPNEEEFGVMTAVPPAAPEQFSVPPSKAVKGGWGVKPAWGPSKNNSNGMEYVDDESPLWGGGGATASKPSTAKGGWTNKSNAKAADHDAWLTSGSPVPASSLIERGRHHPKTQGTQQFPGSMRSLFLSLSIQTPH
jgi:hypothetical protein